MLREFDMMQRSMLYTRYAEPGTGYKFQRVANSSGQRIVSKKLDFPLLRILRLAGEFLIDFLSCK